MQAWCTAEALTEELEQARQAEQRLPGCNLGWRPHSARACWAGCSEDLRKQRNAGLDVGPHRGDRQCAGPGGQAGAAIESTAVAAGAPTLAGARTAPAHDGLAAAVPQSAEHRACHLTSSPKFTQVCSLSSLELSSG